MVNDFMVSSVSSEKPLYAVLRFADCKLLVPQREIRSLESVLDLVLEKELPTTVGSMMFVGKAWPAYCLTSELAVIQELPSARRVCALLSQGSDSLALVCDQLEVLPQDSLNVQPLPACMVNPDSPVEALAIFQGNLGCITSTARLAAYLVQTDSRENEHAS
jgi:hypothetical protein